MHTYDDTSSVNSLDDSSVYLARLITDLKLFVLYRSRIITDESKLDLSLVGARVCCHHMVIRTSINFVEIRMNENLSGFDSNNIYKMVGHKQRGISIPRCPRIVRLMIHRKPLTHYFLFVEQIFDTNGNEQITLCISGSRFEAKLACHQMYNVSY